VPTIQGIDSFQGRILPTAINATNGWYSSVNNGGTLPNHGGGGITFDAANASQDCPRQRHPYERPTYSRHQGHRR